MTSLVIDENEKVRKFKTCHEAEKYLLTHSGTYFVIDIFFKSLYLYVIKSEGGKLIPIKDFTAKM